MKCHKCGHGSLVGKPHRDYPTKILGEPRIIAQAVIQVCDSCHYVCGPSAEERERWKHEFFLDRLLITVYTDGSCLGNPGPGGWAFLVHYTADREVLGSGQERLVTTNNRMELLAVLSALESLTEFYRISLFTDSNYVLTGVKKPSGHHTHSDLWRRMPGLIGRHDIEWIHLPAHSGHPIHDRVDHAAREAAIHAKQNMERP